MTERQLVRQFAKDLNAVKDPDLFFNVMKDTYGGHKKPFDALACFLGEFFAFEFKRHDGKLEEHQRAALAEVNAAGGYGFEAWFSESGKSLEFFYCDTSLGGWHKSGKTWFLSRLALNGLFGNLIIAAEHARKAE